MKNTIVLVLMVAALPVFAQTKTTQTLRGALLEQLLTTHNKKEWFVPVNTAVEGLSAEKAMWKDSSGNHSVAQLVGHLVFWNAQTLAKMKKQKPETFSGNNEETFAKVDAAQWSKAVKDLDEVMTGIEDFIAHCSEAELQQWAPTVANISTHNAYHTGQIIFVRKQQGAWDPANGVK